MAKENIISAVIRRRDPAPVIFVPLTSELSAKDVMTTKRMRRTQREIS